MYELRVRLRELITEYLLTEPGRERLEEERERRIQHAKDELQKQKDKVRGLCGCVD